MAIQMRRGNKADFDPTKMLPGEWAVSIDSDTTKQWVWMCFAPGVVKRMAAFEDIEWVLSDEFAKSSVICDVELDSTATKAYAVGDFLMLHGHLYQVTAAIAIGDTITEGTNVSETTVMATVDGKVDKEAGKGLSTEDYTSAEKTKLGDLPTATDLQTALSGKVDKVDGKGLSTEDYSTAEKTKLAGLPTGTDLADDLSDLNQAISNKVDKVTGKGLSTEDYSTAEKTKLTALPDAATLNADLASKADDSVVVKSVNTKTPTNGAVEVTAEDIPADGIGDKSVSGNPITIEDSMASVAKELSVTLEPIQDLHGYESPWIGTDTDKQPYLFRAISESVVQDKGTHELDKLVGGTVAWNQLVQNGNFADTSNWRAATATFSVSSNVGSFTATAQNGRISQTISAIAGHKYILCGEIKTTTETTEVDVTGAVAYTCLATTNWQIFAKFLGVTQTGNIYFVTRDKRASGWDAVQVRNYMCIDLTQMFGSTIADAIYSLEHTTAGAGVAWFRKLFPAPYYAYDSGSLISVKTSAHVTTGKNLFNYDDLSNTPEAKNTDGEHMSVLFTIPGTYYVKAFSTGGGNQFLYAQKMYADGTKSGISYVVTPNGITPATIAISQGEKLIIWNGWPNTSKEASVNAFTGKEFTVSFEELTAYEPYTEHSYALDSDLELRGISKLDSNNNLYYDGDVYEASGNVQRKYGVVDLGTLNWASMGTAEKGFYTPKDYEESMNLMCAKYVTVGGVSIYDGTAPDKSIGMFADRIRVKDTSYGTDAASFTTAMSGVYLVYELATPTTETADPYTSMQVIDTSGTEEYVDARTVPIPVGHESAYANVCPIEGRTGTEVQRNSPNIWDEEWELGMYDSNKPTVIPVTDSTHIRSKNPIPVMANATYYMESAGANTHLIVADDEGNVLSKSTTLNNATFTTPANAKYMYFNMALAYGTAYNNDISVNYPSTETAYHAYSEDTASVTFGQTVYGGQVDFVSGKCRVMLGYVEYDGSSDEAWTYETAAGGKNFYLNIPTARAYQYAGNSRLKCNRVQTNPVGAAMTPYVHISYGKNVNVCIGDVIDIDNVADFKTWLADNPLQLVYELETTIELTLTPAQLSLLEGTNILTADGTINLTYLGSEASNVQDEIDEFENGLNNVIGSIAFIENSTAKTSHAVGEYIILNGIFCKVISAISSGETLSFGTNIQATTIGAELRAIWAQISA